MQKNVMYIMITVALLLVLFGCSTPPTEEEAKEQVEAFFSALQTDELRTVYDTYGSKEWKADESFETFASNVFPEENEELEMFDIVDVKQAPEDQTIIDANVTYRMYTSDVRIILTPKLEIASLELLQPIARLDFPETIIEKDVIVGKDTSFPLEGKITIPKDTVGNVPAVVLVHGSGQADKDETAYAYKPFRDIAWGLAERGIASIRYDKRTFVYGNNAYTEGLAKMNVQEETIDDAVQAVHVLLEDERIDSDHIYIAGHSLGGMLAPRISISSPDVAGVISLAGSPRPLTSIILDQQLLYLDEQSLPEEIHKQQEAEIEQMRGTVEDMLKQSEDDILSEQLFGLPAYYFWEMEQHPVEEMIASLNIPMYILQGDADFQVFKESDYVAWQNVLENKPNVSFSSYPNLNHFFIEVDEDAGTWVDSYERPGIVSAQVIDDLATWINKQLESEKGGE